MRLPGLFGRLKAAVVGVVHVGALPGTPRSSFPLTQIIDQACQEAEAYKDAGVFKTGRFPSLTLPVCGCPDSREDEERQPKHSTRWITNVCADSIHRVRSCCLQCSCPDVSMAAELSLAEGLVLTRTVTAVPTEPQELKEVKHAMKIPVMIWSGVTLENVRNYLDADTLIIGSYFQKEGYWANHVDPDRVKKFMEHISKLRE